MLIFLLRIVNIRIANVFGHIKLTGTTLKGFCSNLHLFFIFYKLPMAKDNNLHTLS